MEFLKKNCISCVHFGSDDNTCNKESYPEDAENPKDEKKCFDIHPWIAQARHEDLEQHLASEQQRTLRYKELLYSQDERGKEIERLEQRLAESEKENALLKTWVKHHQRTVEIVTEKRHEMEKQLAEARSVIEKIRNLEIYDFDNQLKYQTTIRSKISAFLAGEK